MLEAGPLQRLAAEHVFLDPDELPASTLALRLYRSSLRVQTGPRRPLLVRADADVADDPLTLPHVPTLYTKGSFAIRTFPELGPA